MELFESSKIAFATIADYLVVAADYDPEASWDVALRDVVGAADVDAYRDFADNVRSSCLSAHDAPQVTEALEDHDFATLIGDHGARRRTRSFRWPARLRSSADHLLERTLPERGAHRGSPALAGVLRPSACAPSRSSATSPTAGPARPKTARPTLAPLLAELRARHRRVFGDVMDMTLDGLCSDHTHDLTREQENSMNRTEDRRPQHWR